MTQYFINGKEFPADIAEETESLNREILNDAINRGDMSHLASIKFVVCVETK